jgi:hypothetical protein
MRGHGPAGRQLHYPAAQVIRAEPGSFSRVNAVIDQGVSQPPLNSNIGPKNAPTGQIKVKQAGTVARAAPTAGDGGAAEFDVAVSGSSPEWTVTLTWLSAGLAALPLGKTSRTVTITSVGDQLTAGSASGHLRGLTTSTLNNYKRNPC